MSELTVVRAQTTIDKPQSANNVEALKETVGSDQWNLDIQAAVKTGLTNTGKTDENQAAAKKLYKDTSPLSGANDPVDPTASKNAGSIDPWLQYIGKDNADLTIHQIIVKKTDNDGKEAVDKYSGSDVKALLDTGNNGGAYRFDNNNQDKLNYGQPNADGSLTVGKTDPAKFVHVFVGGDVGGQKDVSVAVQASGDGYIQTGVDVKAKGFDGNASQNDLAKNPQGFQARNSSYQEVTAKPSWFAVSSSAA